MSTTIDSRVVEMRFDNKNFESNVKTTMSTLDKLKSSLRLDGAAKGLESINASAKKTDLSGLSSGIETVQARFSALQVIGVTALANITNSAINAGKQMISALTVQPITTGFNEYELKMNSIQTIMASTGESLDTVNKYLNELNEYSDQTIYSFSDMTQNIGKFTNAGVKLEDAVMAIKGISNEAALSGANANEASRAMYNFAQALSAGYVKLIDWKSIENANMATVEFKNQLLEAGVAAKTLEKQADGMYKVLTTDASGSKMEETINATTLFNDSLSNQWMTTEVLVSTLKDYASETTDIGIKAKEAATRVTTFSKMIDTLKESAQSGWAQTWEIVFGDFEEGTNLWTSMNNAIGKVVDTMSDSRNNFLSEIFQNKSWEQLSSKVEEAGVSVEDFKEELIKTGKKHGKVTDEMIEEAGSFEKSLRSGWASTDIITEALKNLADGAGEFSESTEDMKGKLEKFQKVFDAVWRGDFGNGEERVKKLTEAGYDYAEVQDLINNNVAGTTLKLEDLSDAELKAIGYTEEEVKALRELADQAEKTGTPLNKLIDDLSKTDGRTLVIETFTHLFEEFGKILDAIGESWSKFFGDFSISDVIYNAIEALHDFAMEVSITEGTVENMKKTFDGVFAIFKTIGLLSGGAFGAAVKLFNNITYALKKSMGIDFWGFTGKIGEQIYNFYQWIISNNEFITSLKELGNQFSDFITKVLTGITEWVKAFASLDSIKDGFLLFGTAIGETANGLLGWFSELLNLILNFGNELKNLGELSLDTISEAFFNFVGTIGEHLGKLGEVFSSIGEAISKFYNNLIGNVGEANSQLGKFWDNLVEFISGVKKTVDEFTGFAEILTILAGVGIVAGIIKFSKWVSSITKVIFNLSDTLTNIGDSIASIAKSIAGVFKGIERMFDGFGKAAMDWGKGQKYQGIAAIIKSIALAVAVMAGAFYLLSRLSWEDIGKGAVAIGAIAVSLGVLAFVLSKIGTISVNVQKGSIALVQFALAIAILVGALKVMETVDAERLIPSMAALVILIGAMIGVAYVMDKFKSKELVKGMGSLIIFAGSIFLLAQALKSIDGANLQNAGESVLVLIALMASMVAVSKLMGKISIGSGIGMIAVVIALKLLVSAVKDLAELNPGELIAVIGTFILLVGSIAILMKTSAGAGKYAAKAGIAMIGVGAALILIIAAIKLLAGTSQEDLVKGGLAVAGLLIVFGAVVALSKFAGKYAARAGIMLIGMAAAMVLLAGVIVILSHVDPSGLDRAVDAVSQVMLVLTILVAALGKTAGVNGDSFKALTALIVGLGVLMIAIGILSFIDADKLRNTVISLSLVMLAFGGLIASIGRMGEVNGKTIVTLAILVGVIAALALCVGLLAANTETGAALQAAIGLSALLLAISVSVKLLSGATPFAMKAMPTVALLTLIVAALALILGVLVSNCKNVDSILPVAEGLSVLLLSLSACCVILGAAGVFGPAAFIGIGVLAALIIGIGALIVAIGALADKFPKLEEFLNKGLPLLEKIGQGIGSFFGGIIGGFLDSASDGLVKMAENLSTFIEKLQPFLDGVSDIDPSSIDGVKTLAEALLILTAGNLLNRITDLIPGGDDSFANFADQLVSLGVAMKAYSKEVEGLDTEAIRNSAEAAKALAEVANAIPTEGGLWSLVAGDKNLTTFGTHLLPFGTAMKLYAQEVTGINTEAIVASAQAAKGLAEVANAIPTEGGLWGIIAGDKNLGDFAAHLVPFGMGMKQYATEVTGINNEAIVASVASAKGICEVANAIPTEGGLWSLIAGDKNLGTFAGHLVPFGAGMKAYAAEVTGLNTEAITASVEAAKGLVEVANSIPESCSLWSIIAGGEKNLGDFANQLVSFGWGMNLYAQAVTGIDSTSILSSVEAAKGLVEVANAIPADGPIWECVTGGDKDLGTFGGQLVKFGQKVAEYSEKVAEVDATAINNSVTFAKNVITLVDGLGDFKPENIDNFKIKSLATKLKDYSTEASGISSLTITLSISAANTVRDFINSLTGLNSSGVGTFVDAVKQLSEVSFTDLVNAFAGGIETFTNIGAQLVDAISVGAQSRAGTLTALGTQMVTSMGQSILSGASQFNTIGVFLMTSFITGLSSQATLIGTTITAALASAASAAMLYYVSFHSAGVWLGQGLVNGINSMKTAAYNAGFALGQAAARGEHDGQESGSPSKLTYQEGLWFGEGLVNGINKMGKAVYNAGYGMGKTATDSLTNAISKANDLINGDMVTQPTIRPVLDLSDVSSGAAAISGLFGNQSLGLTANTSAISSMMSRRQNGSFADVVSEIKSLGKSLDNLPTNTTTINGITYDDGSNISTAVSDLIRAARIEGRV